MKKALVILCVALCTLAFNQEVKAQCGVGQDEMELHNSTNCAIDFAVDMNSGNNVSVNVAAFSTYKQCYTASDYALSINVNLTGGSAVTLDNTNADDYGNLCSAGLPQTRFHANGVGWAAPSVVICTVTELP